MWIKRDHLSNLFFLTFQLTLIVLDEVGSALICRGGPFGTDNNAKVNNNNQ